MFENLSKICFLGQQESAILVLTKSAKILLIINLDSLMTVSFCKIVSNLNQRLNEGCHPQAHELLEQLAGDRPAQGR